LVLEAARRLLVEEGPDAVTALRVSEATGIARTTIYRHWPEREDLLRDTIAIDEPDSHVELTGDTRADLVAMLSHMAERVGHRRSARMMAVAIERSGHRGQTGGPHREMFRRRMEPLRKIIEHGVESGDVSPSVDVDEAVAQLAGPAFFQAVFMRRKVEPDFVTTIVDSFLAANAS
jgi:AcrR family transcriptional regulator